MKSLLSQFVLLNVVSACAFSQEVVTPKRERGSVWELTIPHISFANKTTAEGMKFVLDAFGRQYPKETRLHGLAVGKTVEQKDLITSVELKDISLGEAIQAIADVTWCMWDVKNGTIELLPHTPPANMSAILLESLTEEMARELGDIKNVASVRSLLDRLKIRNGYIENVQFFEDRRVIRIKGANTELKIIEAVIEMARRGVSIKKL